jgi:hypothetical protein
MRYSAKGLPNSYLQYMIPLYRKGNLDKREHPISAICMAEGEACSSFNYHHFCLLCGVLFAQNSFRGN